MAAEQHSFVHHSIQSLSSGFAILTQEKCAPDDITPGQYQLHRLGEFNVTTDDSLIWFGRSWATAVAIGSRLHFPGETSRWEAWLNLKFDGESWGGKGKDLVVCDRVILVRKDN